MEYTKENGAKKGLIRESKRLEYPRGFKKYLNEPSLFFS